MSGSPTLQPLRFTFSILTGARRPQPGSLWSADIWAPELHHFSGIWYSEWPPDQLFILPLTSNLVYFSGAHPDQGNRSHRTLVLKSTTKDPMDPTGWGFLGPLRGMPDLWAIDASVFTLDTYLYCCFSGWPKGDFSDTEQFIYIIQLARPEEADPGTLNIISKPTLGWERLGNRGINEGPQFLKTPGFRGIVYSACGSWTNKYKLGVLKFVGPNPLYMSSWRKCEKPLMMSDPDRGQGPYGPGHAS